MRPSHRRQAGFTLIELLVVAVLISIMMAIAVPSFASFISNYRATSAINEFLQGITQTRTEALKRGRRVTMAPVSTDWRNGWHIFIDSTPSGNQEYDPGEELIFSHDRLPATIAVRGPGAAATPFVDPNNSRSYIAFDGSGYPRSISGAMMPQNGMGIVMTDTLVSGASNTHSRTLCLATMGRPRVVKGNTELCTGG